MGRKVGRGRGAQFEPTVGPDHPEGGFAKVGSILNDLPPRKPGQSLLDAINEEAGGDVTQAGLHRDLDFFRDDAENGVHVLSGDPPTLAGTLRTRLPKGAMIQPVNERQVQFQGEVPGEDLAYHQPYQMEVNTKDDLTADEIADWQNGNSEVFPSDGGRLYRFYDASHKSENPIGNPGEQIGHIDLSYDDSDEPSPFVNLSSVDRAYRGQKLGRRLYEEVIQDLATHRPDLHELRSSPVDSLMSAYSQGTWRSLGRDWPVELREGKISPDGDYDADTEKQFTLDLDKAREMLASPTREATDAPRRPIRKTERELLTERAKELAPNRDTSSFTNNSLQRFIALAEKGQAHKFNLIQASLDDLPRRSLQEEVHVQSLVGLIEDAHRKARVPLSREARQHLEALGPGELEDYLQEFTDANSPKEKK
jgi:GNAT superfamily N-acetyltransferase